MKNIFIRLFLVTCLISIATISSAQYNNEQLYATSNNGYEDFVLPLDINVSDSVWFKGWLSDLSQGISAYLHSDCDLAFDVYTSRTATTPKYQAVFTKNRANTIDGETIARKLKENGLGGIDMAFYICISPIGGQGGRLIMQYDTDIMPSTCEDPLYLFPGMSLYSKQPTDVYLVDPSQIPTSLDVIIAWEGDDETPCQLTITQSSCDGPILAQMDMYSIEDVYIMSKDILYEARKSNQSFY